MARGGSRQGKPGASICDPSAVLDSFDAIPDTCWLWTGASDRRGHGKVRTLNAEGRRSSTNAHRAVYLILVGPIPSDLQLDHLCRNPSCVNPGHMEPVTNDENQFRRRGCKPYCPAGHAMTEDNRVWRSGCFKCRTCIRERDNAYKRRTVAERREATRVANRRYYEANRERLKEAQRGRREAVRG